MPEPPRSCCPLADLTKSCCYYSLLPWFTLWQWWFMHMFLFQILFNDCVRLMMYQCYSFIMIDYYHYTCITQADGELWMTLWRLDMGWKKDDPYVSAFRRYDKSDVLHFWEVSLILKQPQLNWGMQAPRRTMWYSMPNNCRMWFCAWQSSENDSIESLDILLMA